MQSSTETYYDASGKVVKTEPANIGDGLQIQFLNATTVKTSASSDDSYQYTLTNVDDKIILTVGDESYELKINNNTMSWSVEAEIDDDTAVKGVTTIQLNKI